MLPNFIRFEGGESALFFSGAKLSFSKDQFVSGTFWPGCASKPYVTTESQRALRMPFSSFSLRTRRLGGEKLQQLFIRLPTKRRER
jgi:hypothetical protein